MSILQMSISAGLLVSVIVIIRAIALNRLPKTMFLILWGVVLLRLFVPVSIPSPFSVYTAISEVFNQASPNVATPIIETVFPIGSTEIRTVGTTDGTEAMEVTGISESAKTTKPFEPTEQRQIFDISPTIIIWLFGTLVTFIFFVVVYFKNHRELRFALCVRGNDFLDEWLATHRLLRPITILQSDRITTPVAIGIAKPRIILPKVMNMDDIQLLRYVLTHEYYHIRRFDTIWKVFLALALCIHWFNPLIWVMFILANRDLELTCDEMVIHHFGADTKTAYAYSLISMAEQRSKFTPLYNGFSKNSAEERIRAIMKYRKPSIIAVTLAVALVIGTTTAFAFSASADVNLSENQQTEPKTFLENTSDGSFENKKNASQDSSTLQENTIDEQINSEIPFGTRERIQKQIHYIGNFDSDYEAIQALESLLQDADLIREDLRVQAQNGGRHNYEIVKEASKDVYAIIGFKTDDADLYQKLHNNEVSITSYYNVYVNGKKMNVHIVRYK